MTVRAADVPDRSGSGASRRPRSVGKFLFEGERKLYLKGTTYGTFRPGPDGSRFPSPDRVRFDLRRMSEAGLNAVRTYTVPPRFLLDEAGAQGMRVLVGLPWEQHVAFLDDRSRERDIVRRVREGARACAGHPALLGFTIGNEIPSPIVRWSGRRHVERFLERLHRTVKDEDPEALVSYANYPTTEYLQLPFLDFACFNVYLECPQKLANYLARLQNLAGDKPLILGELGLDSARHGERAQARAVEGQLRAGFAAGAAGAFVFSWTDEWHRGGHDVTDWRFGLTTAAREPKPALSAVRRVLAELPHSSQAPAPRISVVVCAYNAEATLRDTLEGIGQLRYPNFETVVVDDGSTDTTAAIAAEYPVRLIRTENRGLSAARNRGIHEATGQIVAFVDADAWPDPDWLTYLARSFSDEGWVGVGGPNLPPEDDGPVAHCVANAPGGPVHVLLSDREAEHIPGCNMAFWKSALVDIGGFDERFRTAGDDVDLCWRLQQRGWKLGFNPAALVWHRHRGSVRAYWRQQWGYGVAEALLEQKWPEKYNSAGHVTWGGRVYGRGIPGLLAWTSRIYQGTWGQAPFQRLHERDPGIVAALAGTPEWYLLILSLAAITGLGLAWAPLLWAGPLLAVVVGALLVRAFRSAARSRFPASLLRAGGPVRRFRLRTLTAALHLIQPLARLLGRLGQGLTPWRLRAPERFRLPRPRTLELWSEQWDSVAGRMETLEERLRFEGAVVRRGGAFDRWDLEVRGGMAGWTRLRSCIEEHGDGRQLVRLRVWPGGTALAFGLLIVPLALAVGAAADGAWSATTALLGMGLLIGVRTVREGGMTTGLVLRALGVRRPRVAHETVAFPAAEPPPAPQPETAVSPAPPSPPPHAARALDAKPLEVPTG